MRLKEFKNPVLLEAAPAAAVVAAWPWLVGLFGAAGATMALQQNPQAVEDFSEWAVDSLPDARTMEPSDRNLIMSPYGSMIDGLSQAWDYVTSSDEPTQAEINKRVDDALAANAQKQGGERTEEILAKYRNSDAGKVDPALQRAADAEAREHEALVNKLINKPTTVTPQSQAQTDKTLDKIIQQRTTPSAKADPSDDAIADKIIGRKTPAPAKADPSDDAIVDKMITRDAPAIAPGADVQPGEAPSAKGRDVAEAGAIAKPEAGTIAKPEAGTVPGAKVVPRADAMPKAAAPAQPVPVMPAPIAQPPAAVAKPGTIKKAPRLGGAVYTGSLKGTPPKNILRLKK